MATAAPVSAKVLDGSAIVHMLSPGQSKTFEEYAQTVFIPFINKELETVSRLDVVWDRYDSDSLKNSTRENRGSGQRTRVHLNTKIPKGWANFLRDGTNKAESFDLLATHCHNYKFPADKELYVTNGPTVLSSIIRDKQGLEPCNHEEADTRMFVHVADAVANGHKKIMLRTVDTDVVVLAVACVPQLPQLEELWVHVGTGKNHQFLSCHAIAACLGPVKAEILPVFHAFTGCDTTSFFCGKKSAFEAWVAYPALTDGLKYAKEGKTEQALPILETFIVTMYDKSSTTLSVNECRKSLFTKKDRSIENLPPTKDALQQHVLRTIYQGGFVWGQILKPEQDLPSPADWGWRNHDGIWQPVWTSLPLAATACLELIRCHCKKNCTKCNCIKKQIKCTELCSCNCI